MGPPDAPVMSTAPITRPRPVPLPRTWGIRPADVVALLVANGVFIVLMWVRHGGPDELAAPGGLFTAGGQLMALLGTYLALIGIVLVGRSPWLDQAFGPDRLIRAHRWLGFATVWLIGGHVAFTLTGWAIGDGQSLVAELVDLVTGYPYVLWGVAGFLLFLLVGISSMAAARRRASYETWYWIHVYAYLAVALAFLHQLFVGVDFTHDQLAATYWISLYALTAALVLVFRFGQPLVLNRRHRLRVAAITPEGPGVVSVYVAGRDLEQPGGPLRPVLRRALPVPPLLVAGPSVLAVVGAQRRLAPVHGQGAGRRLGPGQGSRAWAPASSWRVRTGTSPAPAARAPR